MLLSLPLSKINKHLGRNVVAISIFAAFVSVKLLAEVIHDGAIDIHLETIKHRTVSNFISTQSVQLSF